MVIKPSPLQEELAKLQKTFQKYDEDFEYGAELPEIFLKSVFDVYKLMKQFINDITVPQHLVCRVVQSLHTNHMQMSIIEVFICRRLHMNTSMILICIWGMQTLHNSAY